MMAVLLALLLFSSPAWGDHMGFVSRIEPMGPDCYRYDLVDKNGLSDLVGRVWCPEMVLVKSEDGRVLGWGWPYPGPPGIPGHKLEHKVTPE